MKIGHKVSLSVLLWVFLVTVPGVTVIYNLARTHYLSTTISSIEASTRAHIALQISILRRAEGSLWTLANSLGKALQAPPNPDEIAKFDTLVAKDKHGVIRNRRELFDGRTQAGVFIPKGVILTDDIKRTKLRAMDVLSSFGQAALNHYDGVWFDQLNKTSVIFWRRDADFIYKLEPEHDYTQTLWDQLASPSLNPHRLALWTPAIYESPVKTWVVSVVYPLDIKGRWEGILGHDIALTELLASFRASDDYPDSQHFLLDGFGNYILAGFWQSDLESKGGEFKPDLTAYPQLAALINAKTTSPSAFSPVYLDVNGETYVAFAMHIEKLDWTYLRLVKVVEILRPVQLLFLVIGSLVFVVGLLIAFLISVNVRKMVVEPLTQLAEITQHYGRGDFSQRAKLSGENELTQMGENFNLMADKIAEKQQQLVKSEARYRFVLNSIQEAVLILDRDTQLLFANPALTNMIGGPPHFPSGQTLLGLVYPENRENLQQLVDAAWEGTFQQLQGEFRFITHRNDHLWVKLFLRPSLDDDGNKVLSATLIDISTQIHIERSEKILAEADKLALYGSKISDLAEFIGRELLGLFDFPLIWIGLKAEGQGLHLIPQACVGKNAHLMQGWSDENSSDPLMKVFFTGRIYQRGHHNDGLIDLALPLQNGHGNMGVIGFQTGQPAMDEGLLSRLQQLVDRVSTTFRHAQNQQWLRLQNTAMETAATAIIITDNHGYIVWANEAFSRLSGFSLLEMRGEMLGNLVHSHHQDEAFWQEFWTTLSGKNRWHGEVVNNNKQGEPYVITQSVTPILADDGSITHFLAVQEDITEKKASLRQMEYSATHDSLTDLANRSWLMEYLHISLIQAKRHGKQLAVLFLDLDHFKYVNDTLGHSEGDELLKQVAFRLTGCVFEDDLVARLGGDEFVILLTDVSLDTINHVADKALNLFRQPFFIAGQQQHITTSIGICLYPEDGDDAETLLRKADIAMYHAKSIGKNRYQYFTDAINQRLIWRVALEKDLIHALEVQEFQLVYQPQIDTYTNRVVGLEALIRWLHPHKGLVSPSEFIPVSEETGLIYKLGEWILQTACLHAKQWLDLGHNLTVSVNLSAKQFNNKNLHAIIVETLRQTQLPAENLMLELTESMIMTDIELHILELQALKQLGVHVSIDDFGTGYSSLNYLKRLPIDELKIDKSFIDDIGFNEDDRNIVRSIIALGHNLHLKVLAEGVQNQKQFDFLKENNCDIIQGYYFSKPLMASAVVEFLKSHPYS
ncbi:MAG: EAL domain-containing protein [Methylococcales bacterium]|nr:EAL domain-containing protein [Methylococcales bacterium]